MTKSRGIRAPRRRWTAQELDELRLRFPNETAPVIAADLGRKAFAVYQMAAKLGLQKSPEFLASQASGRLRKDDGRGASSRFAPGHVPANKGLRRPGWNKGRMAETQFKKGSMSGAAQHNYVPIGTERISKDGYLERKFTDDPSVAPQRRWAGVHRLVWEAKNGPIPPGYAVAFLPGHQTTEASLITIDALELISRAELMRRNTIHRYPPELKQTIRLVGKLKRAIEERT